MKMGSVQMCYFRLVYGSRRFLLLLAVKAPSLLSIDGVMLELEEEMFVVQKFGERRACSSSVSWPQNKQFPKGLLVLGN